ncbi:MAG: GNAT family N-acetyltransferase [Gammaproteobacteria bacterium]
MDIIEPTTAEDFRQYYALRWKILRAPWGQPPGSERDPQDADSMHLMLVDPKHVAVGVGRVHFNSIREAQIRYMAIDVSAQRRGLGSRLLAALETRASELGAARVVLDARETALRFYHKHGYEAVGPGPMLYNSIAHVKMRKDLQASTA